VGGFHIVAAMTVSKFRDSHFQDKIISKTIRILSYCVQFYSIKTNIVCFILVEKFIYIFKLSSNSSEQDFHKNV